MAITVSIATPTASESGGVYNISVEAVAVDGAVEVGRQTFSTSISETTQAARDGVAIALAGQITAWKAALTRIKSFAAALAALRTNIEGRL
jgi:hypothetical protein